MVKNIPDNEDELSKIGRDMDERSSRFWGLGVAVKDAPGSEFRNEAKEFRNVCKDCGKVERTKSCRKCGGFVCDDCFISDAYAVFCRECY